MNTLIIGRYKYVDGATHVAVVVEPVNANTGSEPTLWTWCGGPLQIRWGIDAIIDDGQWPDLTCRNCRGKLRDGLRPHPTLLATP